MSEPKAFHERVAETLIAQLKAGTAPWQRPWSAGVPYLPMNPVSDKRYQGINALHLLAQGQSDPRWLTYRQAQGLGAQVQKAEKGTSVQYWKFEEQQTQLGPDGKPVLDADGNARKITVRLERPRVFYAVVFNAEQIDGLPALEHKPRTWNPVDRAEAILKHSQAAIEHGGDRAFYSVTKDSIRLPVQGQFPTAADYYGTALHELGHWTGHASRLDRDLTHPRGSEGYAREELRAEIASMILGDELGLGHDPGQHAAYVGHWIGVLQQDPLEIFRAASAAEKIQHFVLNLEQQQTRTVEPTSEGRAATVESAAEAQASQQAGEPEQSQGNGTYIQVPYAERHLAKAAGARWDRAQKSWYVPDGADAAALSRWTERAPEATEQKVDHGNVAEEERIYLVVPYGERAAAKAAGARWDKSAKSWYIGAATEQDKVRRWLPQNVAAEQLPSMSPREEFSAALRDMGCVVTGEHPIMDGSKQRLPVEGDRTGERSGFYVAHLDGHPAAFIQNHRTGVEIRWKAKGYTLSQAEQTRLLVEAATKQHRRTEELERVHEATSTRLQKKLAALAPATFPTAYMQAKGIGTHPGVFTDADKTTYVPGFDVAGKLWTVQYIDEKGGKRFAKSSRKQGCFHPIGGMQAIAQAPVLVIAEGYATAATACELLGKPTVAAFDAGNLLPVAKALHAKYPDKPVLIVGDDDRAQEQARGINPGRDKAEQAAKAVGGHAALPIFAPSEQRDNPKAFSDFNDLAARSVLGRDGAGSQLRHLYEQAVLSKQHRPDQKQSEQRRAPQKRAHAR